MIVLIIMLIVIIALYLLNYSVLDDTKNFAADVELDRMTQDLPGNEEICKEVQKMVGSNCKIELDDNAKSSAYIYYLNKIILSNIESSKKNFSRVLFITHECIHSIQDKKTHMINFAMANIKNIFYIILIVLLFLRKCSMELIFISFLISFISFYFRIILEADAVYRSVIYSRKYLEKRNLEIVADRYEVIVPKTINGMYFSYLAPVLIRHMILIALFLLIK